MLIAISDFSRPFPGTVLFTPHDDHIVPLEARWITGDLFQYGKLGNRGMAELGWGCIHASVVLRHLQRGGDCFAGLTQEELEWVIFRFGIPRKSGSRPPGRI